MKKILLLLFVASAPLLAGCGSSPIMAGPPGQLRAVPPLEMQRIGGADEPVYCLVSFNVPPTIAEQVPAYVANVRRDFRDLRLLTRERPGPEGCDVLLKIDWPSVWNLSVNTIRAYSAYDGELVWEGSSQGSVPLWGPSLYGWRRLLPHLLGDLRPGRPAFEKIAVSRASGRRLDASAVESMARLIPESSIDSGVSAELRFGQPRVFAPASPAVAVPFEPAQTRLSDVDAPPASGARRRGHAVVIGIERYRQRLPKADFAAADARAMAQYASVALGYPEENVALLTDEGATKGDFEKYFDRWLPNRVDKDDEVFVYFSGHGAPNPRNGDAYLVPYDGDPTYLSETGFPLKRLYAALAKLPAKKVTVALDSCFSGAGGRSVLARGARPLVVKQAEAAPSGLTVLSASASDQISNTYNEQGHGLFTYFLLKGLKEKGADLRAAFNYAKPEVSKVARRQYNADQEPQWQEGK